MHPQDRLPPTGSPVSVQVFSVPDKGKYVVVFLSECSGIITHWGPKGSSPCSGEDQCPLTLHRQRQVFKAYASAMVRRTDPQTRKEEWFPMVFEITERAYCVLKTSEALTSTKWIFKRGMGPYGKNEVLAERLDDFKGHLPFCFDFRPVVERLYRTRNIEWGKEPPFGDPLILAPVPVE